MGRDQDSETNGDSEMFLGDCKKKQGQGDAKKMGSWTREVLVT